MTSLISSFLATSTAQSAAREHAQIVAANDAYDHGDCAGAIQRYRLLIKSKRLSNNEREDAVYRLSNCYAQTSEPEKAAAGFRYLLRKYPAQDDARLHLAEALLAQKKIDEAIAEAQKIKDPAQISEAKLLIARAQIEANDEEKALKTLQELQKQNPGWTPYVEYWRGVAYFQIFDESAAQQAFQRSARNSNQELWTRSASENWLSHLRDDRQWVHARMTLGFGVDTNVAQLRYRTSATGEVDSGTDLQDGFKELDLTISTKPFHLGKMSLTPSFTHTGQYYNTYSAYNPQSLGFQVAASQPQSQWWTFHGSLAWSDSRYNWIYSQDYLTLNLSEAYGITRKTTTHLGLAITRQVQSHPAWSIGPSMGYESEFEKFYWLAGISYTLTSGESAVIANSSSGWTTTSGTLASSYKALNLRVGAGRTVEGFDLFAQTAFTLTSYAKEIVPAGAAFSDEARVDKNYWLQLSASHSIVEKSLTASLSYSYTLNFSDGFQGTLYTTGSSPDYTYRRGLASLLFTYSL